jgi:hypothetical protein
MLAEAGMEKINFSGGEPFLYQVGVNVINLSTAVSYDFS